jgi:6-phosphogluconolactonase
LLNVLKIPDHLVFRMMGENDPVREATRYSGVLAENLPAESGWPAFDLLLLGLGSDGHTASLFPGDNKTLESGNLCEVAIHPQTAQKRITLTLPVINHAGNILFLVTGKEKAEIISTIFRNKRHTNLPASLVQPAFGNVTWLLDQEAASLIASNNL